MTDIRAALFPDDVEAVRSIFREYADGLGVDLGFQDFDSELASLPGKYAAPKGCVFLAWERGEVIGCVAMRAIGEDVCEMKRLYVRVSGRGQQLGRKLAMLIIETAKEAGYRKMKLDTLPDMTAAQQIYASPGFVEINAYVFNPIEGVRFLELNLIKGNRPT
jgi:ribosomal protein S18 acetylase RimI-like enzyme